MQFLLDNMVATVVAGVVGLLLVTLSVDRAEGTRDATRFSAHQTVQNGFVEQLELDLMNAGVLTPSGQTPVLAVGPGRLRFYGVVDKAGTGGVIEYRRVPADSLDGSAVYAVERWSDGVRSGGAPGVVSQFDVEALSASGVPVSAATLGDARSVRVETEWVLPHLEDGDGARRRQALRRSAWGTHIRPLGLQP